MARKAALLLPQAESDRPIEFSPKWVETPPGGVRVVDSVPHAYGCLIERKAAHRRGLILLLADSVAAQPV